jgi:hypothetical protein
MKGRQGISSTWKRLKIESKTRNQRYLGENPLAGKHGKGKTVHIYAIRDHPTETLGFSSDAFISPSCNILSLAYLKA